MADSSDKKDPFKSPADEGDWEDIPNEDAIDRKLADELLAESPLRHKTSVHMEVEVPEALLKWVGIFWMAIGQPLTSFCQWLKKKWQALCHWNTRRQEKNAAQKAVKAAKAEAKGPSWLSKKWAKLTEIGNPVSLVWQLPLLLVSIGCCSFLAALTLLGLDSWLWNDHLLNYLDYHFGIQKWVNGAAFLGLVSLFFRRVEVPCTLKNSSLLRLLRGKNYEGQENHTRCDAISIVGGAFYGYGMQPFFFALLGGTIGWLLEAIPVVNSLLWEGAAMLHIFPATPATSMTLRSGETVSIIHHLWSLGMTAGFLWGTFRPPLNLTGEGKTKQTPAKEKGFAPKVPEEQPTPTPQVDGETAGEPSLSEDNTADSPEEKKETSATEAFVAHEVAEDLLDAFTTPEESEKEPLVTPEDIRGKADEGLSSKIQLPSE